MKYLLCVLGVLSLNVGVHAQALKGTFGPLVGPKEMVSYMDVSKIKPIKVSDLIPSGHFFDIASRRTFTSFNFSKNYMYSENFINPVGNKKFTAEVAENSSERVQILKLLNHNNKLFVFYITRDKKKNELSIYVNQMDKDLVLLGSPLLIQTYSEESSFGSNISFLPSNNHNFFMIYRKVYAGKNEPQQFECKILNGDFAEVSNKSFKLDSRDKDLTIQSIQLDDFGNFYILGENKVDESKATRPEVYFYNSTTKVLKHFPVGPTEGKLFGTMLTLINGVKPYVVGLSQKEKKVSYFISTIDASTGTQQYLGSFAMPEDFYKASNFNAYKTEHWNVDQIVSLENGNIVASVEAKVETVNDGRSVGWYTYYTYLFSFSPAGEQKFQHTVFKIQGGLYEFVGHSLISFKNKAYVIYNDNPGNISVKVTDKNVKGYNMKECMIVVQEIDETGKVLKYPLSKDPELSKFNLSISDFVQIKEDLYFTSASWKKNIANVSNRNILFEFE